MDDAEFRNRLFGGLLRDCHEYQENSGGLQGVVVDRRGLVDRGVATGLALRAQVGNKAYRLAGKLGFVRRHFSFEEARENLIYITNNIDELSRVCRLLADDYSRDLFITILKLRVLGPKHVRPPIDAREYRNRCSRINRDYLQESRTIRTDIGWYLNLYCLQGLAGPISIHCLSANILHTFLLEQYAYQRGGRTVRVETGDTVVDAGACWGDTALYFADRIGPKGNVYSWEFEPDNLRILRQNISLNRRLGDAVRVVPHALWDRSGETLNYSPFGPGTSFPLVDRSPTHQVSTQSLDDFVAREGLSSVDYIKMDVEGSELRALRGAEGTIRRFRPRLAISVYHKIGDLAAIPAYLHGLGLQYEFFLDHFAVHSHETILFAVPVDRRNCGA